MLAKDAGGEDVILFCQRRDIHRQIVRLEISPLALED